MLDNTFVEFEPFRLSLKDESLWRQDERLSLTRKAFAVLRLLVTQAGQLVTRDHLFETIWPNAYVSEATLNVCIRELRRTLGDSARDPQYIETVRGRGFRFIAPVTIPSSANSPFGIDTTVPDRGTTAPWIVDRDRELAILHNQFNAMLRGARQLGFIIGEAGIGKTTLVDAFVSQVATLNALWIGRGQCIDHYGVGEAYLPLLDALGQLGRGPDGERCLAVLRQQAPNWLLQIPALVSPSEVETLELHSRSATQGRMLRELAEAVEALTLEQPVVLVLEDLHWSDHATLDWLAFVARRRTPARLFVLGTYRPADAIVRQHPVTAMVHELQRQAKSVELQLDYLSETGANAYLAGRLGQSALPETLIQLLHQRTHGNPFFLVTMVDEWIRQGLLEKGPEGWTFPRELDAAPVEIPTSIKHLIEQQLEMLRVEDYQLLQRASVAGVQFSAAALVADGETTVEIADTQLGALARSGYMVQAQGISSWPDGTVSGSYGFIHALYQEILYNRVPVGLRMRLHQQLGERLESAYGERTGEVAGALALHFEHGQDLQRAVRYLHEAGEKAVQRSAYQEAVYHLTKGLHLLDQLPDGPDRHARELGIQTMLGPPLMAIQGYGAPAVEQTYTRAYALCQQIGETPELASVLWGLRRYYLQGAALERAREMGERLLALGQRQDDPTMIFAALASLGQTAWYTGEFGTAWSHFQCGLAQMGNGLNPVSLQRRYGESPELLCRFYSARIQLLQGYPEQARQQIEALLRQCDEMSHPVSLINALFTATVLHQHHYDLAATCNRAEAMVRCSQEQGFNLRATQGAILKGWALAMMGQTTAGIEMIEQAFVHYQATGAMLGLSYFQMLLAEAYGQVGQAATGLLLLAEAIDRMMDTGEHWCQAELYRLKGTLLLGLPMPRAAETASCFQHAVDVARRQHAKSWELRAAINLSQLWKRQGQIKAAYDVIEPIYGWFTEGLDTPDLQGAKALLEALKR